ncbi:MAG: DUF370 domain-containing protein [Clostridiales bacterium]|nr:DUF370 domain-containing protein [Clostridiales bacterium]
MYLHVGGDVLVNIRDIIGIFDMENTTVSRLGRHFLTEANKNGEVVYATEDLPKAYVVTSSQGKTRVYISPMSTQVLSRRAESSIITA